MITFFCVNTMIVVTSTIRSAEEILIIGNIVENVVALVVINTHGFNRTVMSPISFHVGLKQIKTHFSSCGEIEYKW